VDVGMSKFTNRYVRRVHVGATAVLLLLLVIINGMTFIFPDRALRLWVHWFNDAALLAMIVVGFWAIFGRR
jgi:hypothetical protein